MKQPTTPSLTPDQDDGTLAGTAGLYPELPHADTPSDTVETAGAGQSYRLQQISILKQQLEHERDKRATLYKKYRRGVNAVDGVDTALVAASLGMGAAGVGLLTTVIAAPVVLGLEIAAVICGLAGMASKLVGRRLLVKAKKHDEIRILAISKLNTIADHVSTALL